MEIVDNRKINISIVIEDHKLQDFVALILMGESYQIKSHSTNQELFDQVNQYPPDLIIADFLSSNVNGLTLCKTIRDKFLLRYTPFILLIPKDDPLLRTKAIYVSADDYVEKPFTAENLLTRVKATLWRVTRYQDINPLTKLPGISIAMKELNSKIDAKESIGVGYADLYQFRKFNEYYGSKKGDDVLKFTAQLIRQALIDLGSPSDFIAHLGTDDFFFISSVDSTEEICQKIITDFDKIISTFYDEEDREKGYISVKNRKGEILKIPILKIHIGATTSKNYKFISCAHVLQVAVELKNYAKQFNKSMYIKERRKSYPYR